jgi:hypothetical protein
MGFRVQGFPGQFKLTVGGLLTVGGKQGVVYAGEKEQRQMAALQFLLQQ